MDGRSGLDRWLRSGELGYGKVWLARIGKDWKG